MDNTINNEQIVSNKAKLTLSIQNLVNFTRKAYRENVPSHMLWKVFVERLLVPDGQTLDYFLQSQKRNSKKVQYSITPKHYVNPNLLGVYHKNVRRVRFENLYHSIILDDDDVDFNIEGFKKIYKFIFENKEETLVFFRNISTKYNTPDIGDYYLKGIGSIYGVCLNKKDTDLYFTHKLLDDVKVNYQEVLLEKIVNEFGDDFIYMDVDELYFTSKADMDELGNYISYKYEIQYGLGFMIKCIKNYLLIDGKTILRNSFA